MASEPDNPFARNSAWPQMPQAPFRVGPLPKADAVPPPPEPKAPVQSVTPVFSRPINAPSAFSGLPSGAITRPNPQPAPRPAPPPEPVVAAPPSAEPEPVAETPPAPPPETYVELAPVTVQPLGSGRKAAPRKSPLPAIAAAGIGLAAVFGIAYALNRGQEAALKAPVLAPPAAVAVAPPPTVVPVAPPAVATTPAIAPAPAPARVAVAPRVAPPRRIVIPAAPATTEPAAAVPVISLPAPATAPPVVAPPQPSYTPPAAPDPNAPMTTKRD